MNGGCVALISNTLVILHLMNLILYIYSYTRTSALAMISRWFLFCLPIHIRYKLSTMRKCIKPQITGLEYAEPLANILAVGKRKARYLSSKTMDSSKRSVILHGKSMRLWICVIVTDTFNGASGPRQARRGFTQGHSGLSSSDPGDVGENNQRKGYMHTESWVTARRDFKIRPIRIKRSATYGRDSTRPWLKRE